MAAQICAQILIVIHLTLNVNFHYNKVSLVPVSNSNVVHNIEKY